VARGKSCRIITLDREEVFYTLDPRISVCPVGQKSENKLLDKLQRYRAVRKMVMEDKPDLVLSFPEEIAVYVILALLGTGIPVYASERNNPWVMPDVKVTRILRTLMYPFAKGIIFQTEMAKSFFPDSIQKKGVVLKNPVDAQRIPAQFGGERENVVVAAGRLSEQKNMPLLIRAFARFSPNHPEFKLRIFGEGELREELTALARELQIADKVELPGRSTALLEKMNSAAMFVLSSDYEGMPNVLLEAMCMGMPSISTDCPSGGPKELIEDGVNGLLIPVGDVDALHQAMEKMADPAFAGQMAEAAYRIREELTSPEIFVSWYRYLFGEEPKTL
jgi:glycosyltransferase involved in cell wall biosynthesis